MALYFFKSEGVANTLAAENDEKRKTNAWIDGMLVLLAAFLMYEIQSFAAMAYPYVEGFVIYEYARWTAEPLGFFVALTVFMLLKVVCSSVCYVLLQKRSVVFRAVFIAAQAMSLLFLLGVYFLARKDAASIGIGIMLDAACGMLWVVYIMLSKRLRAYLYAPQKPFEAQEGASVEAEIGEADNWLVEEALSSENHLPESEVKVSCPFCGEEYYASFPRCTYCKGKNIGEVPYAFSAPEDTQALSCAHVVEQNAPILRVTHGVDGGWQFLCGRTHCEQDSRPITMREAYDRDHSVALLANMQPGCGAWRKKASRDWEVYQLD